jgi:phosphate transport system substrate-binding protein
MAGAVVANAVVPAGPVGAAVPPSQVNASGSSWAGTAIIQWTKDVYSEGVQVTYNPDGDSAGRQDFANKVSDFSVTADGYQGFDPVTGISDDSHGRPYVYLPVAAGGTSFPYQIRVAGRQVQNLRLSGETLAKIFTNQITNWDDPEITADNNGQALPSLPIIPVVQSEGSGSTQQLTNFFAADYPNVWTPYAGQSGPTEYFPRKGNQIAQNGSTGAMNYISSSSANGAIGYVEYSFPLSADYPVAKILNKAGYFTLPTQYNVAVALEDAQIVTNPTSTSCPGHPGQTFAPGACYLLQDLTNVYTDPDSRTYPLSSYVYLIEPTGGKASRRDPVTGTTIAADSSETTGKRQAIADFEYYAICQGQGEIGPIGYSPLPVNLVEAAFGQVQKLRSADPAVDLDTLNIQTCHEPTFVPGHPATNYLTTIAPLPPACDNVGAGPCAPGVTPNGTGPTPGSPGTSGAGANSTTGSGPTGGGPAGSAGTSSASSGSGGPAGRVGSVGGTAQPGARTGARRSGAISTTGAAEAPTSSTGDTAGPAPLVAANLARPGLSSGGSVTLWVVLGLLAVFTVPVVIGYRRASRRGGPR